MSNPTTAPARARRGFPLSWLMRLSGVLLTAANPNGRTPEALVASNLRHLVWDMTWFGLVSGTAITYMQVYIVRLGASSLLVGAITYAPALISILWQMPATQIINRTRRRMPIILWSCLLQRSIYLLVALLPFFVVRWRAEATASLLILQALPGVISMTTVFTLMADAVPANRMSELISWRLVGSGIASTLASLLAGPLLTHLPFPLNYQVLFLIGYGASLVSQWHLTQLCVPERKPSLDSQGNWRQGFTRVWRYLRFRRFIIATTLQQVAATMLTPLLPLLWVRQMHATDEQISLIVTLYSGVNVLATLLMRRAAIRFGREHVLILGTIGFGVYPLLSSLSPSVWWLLPWAMLAGVFNAAIYVTLFDNLVATTTEEERPNFIAIYNVALNVAMFAGPLSAGFLARGSTGPVVGLQVAAGISLIAGLLYARWLGRE
jgi:MFS family permease